MQLELQMAIADPLLRVLQRDSGSGVPHDDLASAVLFGRDGSFEVRIGKRVILDLHGHAFDARVEAGPLGTARRFIVPSSSSLKS